MNDGNEGRIIGPGVVEYAAPEMDGVMCEVQWSVHLGKPVTGEPGLLGVGVMTLPDGQPRLIVQLKHSDGASINAILDARGFAVLSGIFCDAGYKAAAIHDRAKSAVRQ